jgi:hypothetical protein
MKIYVAGEVPRKQSSSGMLKSKFGFSEKWSFDALTKTYREIEDAVAKAKAFTGRSIELKMPYPDPEVDKLEPKDFVEYLRDEISQSDAVLTIFCPPGIAVAFEADLASALHKPQTILVAGSLRIPRFLRVLENVVSIQIIEDVKFSNVLVELTNAVQESAGGAWYTSSST